MTEEFDAEATCQAIYEEINWQIEEWKKEQIKLMEEWK